MEILISIPQTYFLWAPRMFQALQKALRIQRQLPYWNLAYALHTNSTSMFKFISTFSSFKYFYFYILKTF